MLLSSNTGSTYKRSNMERLTFFWLIPNNEAAIDIVLDERNSRFCDIVPRIATKDQTINGPGHDISEMIRCLRFGFDHENASDTLVYFGRDHTKADIVLSETLCSRRHAFLYIDPTSLDLVCRDYSTNRLTMLFFTDPEPVGTWRSMNGRVFEQTVLTHSSTMLAIDNAQFTFLWYHSSLEAEIFAAKSSFARRTISSRTARTQPPTSEVYQRNNQGNKYPEAADYGSATVPLVIMDLPTEIRHSIFRLVFGTVPIKLCWEPNKWLNIPIGFNSVHECMTILDASHQLLNPVYSSRELAVDAASFFYHEEILELNIRNTQSLIWTLQHMPSVQPVDPLSCISNLKLWLNCDGLSFDPVLDDDDYLSTHELLADRIHRAGGDWVVAPGIVAYKWTAADIDNLKRACSACTANFPNLIRIEIHIRKQSMSLGAELCEPDEEVPSHILTSITPLIRKLKDREIRSMKVYLYGQKWSMPSPVWPLPNNKVDSVEDITSWWDDYTENDDQITCEENLKWLSSIPWHFHQNDQNCRRKEAIQASRARQEIAHNT